jgi:dUTPase
LRKVSREHGVYVANAATDVDSRYVQMVVMAWACGKMDGVVEKLEKVVNILMNVLASESPPHDVQEEYILWNLDDPGWV